MNFKIYSTYLVRANGHCTDILTVKTSPVTHSGVGKFWPSSRRSFDHVTSIYQVQYCSTLPNIRRYGTLLICWWSYCMCLQLILRGELEYPGYDIRPVWISIASCDEKSVVFASIRVIAQVKWIKSVRKRWNLSAGDIKRKMRTMQTVRH